MMSAALFERALENKGGSSEAYWDKQTDAFVPESLYEEAENPYDHVRMALEWENSYEGGELNRLPDLYGAILPNILCKILRQEERLLRQRTLSYLMYLGINQPHVLDTLEEVLRADPDVETRILAVTAVGYFRGEEIARVLGHGVEDPSSQVRQRTYETIGRIGSRGLEKYLLKAIQEEKDPVARQSAYLALCEFRNKAWLGRISEGLSDRAIRKQLAAAIQMLLRDGRGAIEHQAKLIRNLTKAYQDPTSGDETRRRIVEALGMMIDIDVEAQVVLFSAIRDSSVHIRALALERLVQQSSPKIIDHLEELMLEVLSTDAHLANLIKKNLDQYVLEQDVARIDSEQIRYIIAERTEHEKVDFKRLPYDLGSKEGKGKFLKVITSIANAKGPTGWVIFGIEDPERQSDSPTRALIIGFDPNTFSEQQATQAVANYCDPIVRFYYRTVQLYGKTIGVLKIPVSKDVPHRITHRVGKLDRGIYVRRGSHTYEASDKEREEMYERRRMLQALSAFSGEDRRS